MIVMMLEEFLETLGHHVQGVATSVEEAQDKIREGGFDLAILDCNLNGEEVWSVAEMLDDTDIPYILSSGGVISEIPIPFNTRPMLAKPYTIGTISDILAATEAMRA